MNREDIKNENENTKKCRSRFCILVVLIVLAFLFLFLTVGLIVYLCVFARMVNNKLVIANLTDSNNLTNKTTIITNANAAALNFVKPAMHKNNSNFLTVSKYLVSN
jgi:cell division protein FtsB